MCLDSDLLQYLYNQCFDQGVSKSLHELLRLCRLIPKPEFDETVLRSSESETGTERTVLINSQIVSEVATLDVKRVDSIKLVWWVSVHNIPIFKAAVIFVLRAISNTCTRVAVAGIGRTPSLALTVHEYEATESIGGHKLG